MYSRNHASSLSCLLPSGGLLPELDYQHDKRRQHHFLSEELFHSWRATVLGGLALGSNYNDFGAMHDTVCESTCLVFKLNTKIIKKKPIPGTHTHAQIAICQDFSCWYYSLSPSKNGDKAGGATSTCIYLRSTFKKLSWSLRAWLHANVIADILFTYPHMLAPSVPYTIPAA